MPKFLTGFVVGVATGYICSGAIEAGLHRFVAFANDKNEEMARKVEESSPSASILYPANGVNGLSPERKREINISTPENPIVLTSEDIDAMEIAHIKANIKSGRFKLAEGSEA